MLCFLQMESTLMDCTKLRFKFWITRCAVICTVQWSLRQWCAHRACLDEVKVWIFPSIFGNYSHFITLTILSTLRHLLKSSVFRWSVFFDFARFWSMLVDLIRSRSFSSYSINTIQFTLLWSILVGFVCFRFLCPFSCYFLQISTSVDLHIFGQSSL